MVFSSKLLLFGEHTILRGSSALALPLSLYSGIWAYSAPENRTKLQRDLPAWCQYLAEQGHIGRLETELDTARFAADLRAGLYFHSNIPTGYGAGSSGALTAAVYTRYARETIERSDSSRYAELKRTLGQMESFFHGASSGTDPLIVYLNQAVLLNAAGEIKTLLVPDWPAPADGFQFFLIDTGISRSTGQWVKLFLERCEDPAYLEKIQEELIPRTAQAIDLFCRGAWSELFTVWCQISALQQQYFAPMIPAAFQELWAEGLNSGAFALKLCGAGGGGFMLGLAKTAFVPENAILLSSKKIE